MPIVIKFYLTDYKGSIAGPITANHLFSLPQCFLTSLQIADKILEVVEIKHQAKDYGKSMQQLELHLKFLEWGMQKLFPRVGEVSKEGHAYLPTDKIGQRTSEIRNGIKISLHGF